jgi:hypothetical protein
MKKEQYLPYVKRLLLIVLISAVGVFVISEIGIGLQNESAARAPQTIEIIIPAGTAARVEAGEDPPGIPDELAFVLGDQLLVHNQDSVTHTLGPLLVPAGASASLPLTQPENLALSCSFKPTSYLNLNVSLPTTLSTRLLALTFAVPPTAALLFVYSLIAFPMQPREAQA